MKKLVALLLGSALIATSVAGLAACGGGPAAPEITRRADPRAADAYEAYNYLGEKVGSYKTIADAINATVTADLDFTDTEDTEVAPGAKGGYVVKKGSEKHLFDNKKGFASGNSDCFWYYEDGNKLAAFNCWDTTQGVAILQNSKIITHQTGSTGTESMQSWNGFALLDHHGNPIDSSTTLPPTWEFSKPMDAGIMAFPARKKGVEGLRYSMDFTNVKITPAYEGVTDPVYAYFGIYVWQDNYVLATGIACDTTTGQWYPFRGTSRDDSFYDIVYNVEGSSKPLFTSTWHEDENGGYFTPDVKTADLEVKTYRGEFLEDEERYYWDDKLSIVFDKGLGSEFTYDLLIDDVMMNNYWGLPIACDNGYVFIAGLDIKNHAEDVSTVPNVDYFNGAKFENLTVTAASVYFPTEEEMTDDEYTLAIIDPELRGKWHDALMANDEVTNGTWDYTYLYNYACTSYEKKDGTDVYSFKFDGSPVADELIGGKLKEYQDKIDSLKNMTVDNIADYLDTYDEITTWYGVDDAHTGSSGILQQYLLVLDFAPYIAAKPTYEASFNLSEEGQKVRDELETYSVLSNYTYKGWEAPAGTEDVKGYLWSEAQKFGALLARYNKLEATDQSNILRLYSGGATEFGLWREAYEGIHAYLNNAAATGASYKIANIDMGGGTTTYTGTQALQKLFELSSKIHTATYSAITTGEDGMVNSDDNNCFHDSFHLLYLAQKLRENEVLPDIYEDVFLAMVSQTARSKNFVSDFDNYIYPVLTLAGRIYTAQQNGDFLWLNDEIAKIINDHMIGFSFTEGGFLWNMGQSNHDIRNTNQNYEAYFGLPNAGSWLDNEKYIVDFVKAADPAAVVGDNGYGFKAAVTALAEDPRETVSDEVKAVYTAFAAFSVMPKYEYKGWTTTEEDIKGYLFTELAAFKEKVKTLYDNLSTDDKADFAIIANMNSFNAWMKLAEDTTILETYPALDGITVHTYSNPKTLTEQKDFTGMELFDHLVRWAYKLYIGGSFGEYNDYRQGNGILDFNGAPFPSSYLCLLYETLTGKAGEGYELPKFVQDLFEEIKFDTFYKTAWYPVVGTARLAQRIHDENPATLGDLTDEELKFLNEVWVNSYTIGDLLTWNWNDGKKFETYLSDAMAYMTVLGGCTLTEEVKPEKEGDPTERPYRACKYFEIVQEFLEKCGYTVNPNGWGVTDGTIEIPKEEAPIVTADDINTNFAKLSVATDMSKYSYKGWTTRGSNKQGYLFSEITLFDQIVAAYDKLDDTEKAKVTSATGDNWKAWKSISEQLKAIPAEKLALEVKGADRDEKTAVNYTVGEVLGELLAVVERCNTKGIKLNFDNGIDGNVSFRAYYFIFTLEDMGITVPKFVLDAVATVEDTDDTGGTLKTDIKYIMAIMKLAAALKADPDYVLTDEDITMVNETMVGKKVFINGGFNYSYYNDGKCKDVMSWHSKGYKIYYGITEDFCESQKLVIGYLVENYDATALKYDKPTDVPDDNMMGIEAEISAPVAE